MENKEEYKRKMEEEFKIMSDRKNNEDLCCENAVDNVLDDPCEKRKDKRDKKKKKITKYILMSIMSIAIIYCGIALYFNYHYLYGTEINGINVSFKSIPEVDEQFKSIISDYTLKLDGRENTYEEIKGSDLHLKYSNSGKEEIRKIKKSQGSIDWIKSLFEEYNKEFSYYANVVSYDESGLEGIVNNLQLLNSQNIIAPKNATIKFENEECVIVKEVYGTTLNKENFNKEIVQAISRAQDKINLDESNCYENPTLFSTSQEILDAKEKMKEYSASKITYQFGNKEHVLDGNQILKMLVTNDKGEVIVDEKSAQEYVAGLAEQYNTLNKTRKFTTTKGTVKTIYQGDYGVVIDKAKEVTQLINDIQSKKPVARTPVYSNPGYAAGGYDIGNTYVEIDMGNQYVWFYKNGSVIAEGSVVTGKVNAGMATPEGVYSLKYKVKDTYLVGVGYKTHVDYWMPFNGGIGMHDASWRGTFGGNIYVSNGSHGCINMPFNLAKTVFNNIEAGTPIVCYY